MRYPGNAASFTATRDGERHAHPALPVQTAPRCVVLPGNDALRILLPGNAASFTATCDAERDGHPALLIKPTPLCAVLPSNDALRILLPGNAASFTATRDSERDGPRQRRTDCTAAVALPGNETLRMRRLHALRGRRANLFVPLPGSGMRYPGNATSFTATLPHSRQGATTSATPITNFRSKPRL